MRTGGFRLAELGFAEFTALLITETLEAVIAALLEQEKTVADFEQSLLLPPAEFGRRYLTEEHVRAELLCLFPDPRGREGKSAVDPGAPYRPPTAEQDEDPPIFARTGYRMAKGDWEKGPEGFPVISAQGYEKVAGAVREVVALRQQESLRALIARGIPRVYIDHGRVAAKLTFRFEERREGKQAPGEIVYPGRPFPVRLLVQPVNTRGPEFLTLKADVTSEVELTFKTIVP
ncbi:hypothetical protein [Thermodesulfitimonas autotrophica]|uniref:hypothetical protein n=1 Tax=Thermodesulfitimonas autotrophica TaxID=1894989 RepID=UPI002FE0A2DC